MPSIRSHKPMPFPDKVLTPLRFIKDKSRTHEA